MKTPTTEDIKKAAKLAFPDASRIEVYEESEYQISGVKSLAVYVWRNAAILGYCAFKLSPAAIHKAGPVSETKRVALNRKMRIKLFEVLKALGPQ